MVMPKHISPGREKSHFAKGEHRRNVMGALHHHRQMGVASLPALALFSQEIRLPIASANESHLARSALTCAKLHCDPQGMALKLAKE